MRKKNIILTGQPHSGKSTLLESIINELPNVHGMLTREILSFGNRVGFAMGNFKDMEGAREMYESDFGKQEDEEFSIPPIAHVNFFDSEIRVGRYGVDVEAIDNAVNDCEKEEESRDQKLLRRELALAGEFVKPFSDDAFSEKNILYIDEIGQMQLYSKKFKKFVKQFLDYPNTCIMTLSAVHHDSFTESIRRRNDVIVIDVTEKNRNQLRKTVKEMLA